MKIYFQNLGLMPIKRKIKKLYLRALEKAGIDFKGFSVNLRFVDKAEIQTLNNNFRQIDKPTDVLSFPTFNFIKGQGVSPKEISENISIDDNLAPLGDIAICKAIATAQAKEYGHSYKREVCFLAQHGFLHLLGYDHLTPEDEAQMQGIAKEILELEKVKR